MKFECCKQDIFCCMCSYLVGLIFPLNVQLNCTLLYGPDCVDIYTGLSFSMAANVKISTVFPFMRH